MLMTVKGYGYHRYHEHGDENTVSSSRQPLRTAQQALQTISVETALNEVHALHIMNNLLQTRYQWTKSWLYSGLLMVNG